MQILQYIHYPSTVNFISIPAPSSAKSRQSYAANSRSSVSNQNGHAEPKVDPKAAPGGRLCLPEPETFGFVLQFKVIEGENLKIQTSIEFVQIFILLHWIACIFISEKTSLRYFLNFHLFDMIPLSSYKNFLGYLNFPARRKSNCVKEVEKIQQKRDERRAKHLAIKEQNEQHFDTADPNWEFQAMIK